MLNLDISLFFVALLVWFLMVVLNKIYFKPAGLVLEQRESKIESESSRIEFMTREIEEKTQQVEKNFFRKKEGIMSITIKWPQRKEIKSPRDLYGYIAYLAALTFIFSAKFLSETVRIILAIATIFIFLVTLAFTFLSEKDKQTKGKQKNIKNGMPRKVL